MPLDIGFLLIHILLHIIKLFSYSLNQHHIHQLFQRILMFEHQINNQSDQLQMIHPNNYLICFFLIHVVIDE